MLLLVSLLTGGSTFLLARFVLNLMGGPQKGEPASTGDSATVLAQEWWPGLSPYAPTLARTAVIVAAVPFILIHNFVLAAFFAYIAYRAPLWLLHQALYVRSQRFEEQVPVAVNIMAASVRATNSLTTAVKEAATRTAAPLGKELAKISAEQTQGLSLEEALGRARSRTRSEGFSMILTALMIGSQQGGDLIEMMERISDSIRALDRLRKKILSETSGIRAQKTTVLCMNPVAVLMICALGTSMRHILFSTWKGTLIIIVAFLIQFFCLERIRAIERSAI